MSSEEPPTVPRRTSTGNRINPRVIRAMSRQFAAESQVHASLDKLISIIASTELDAPERVKELVRKSLLPPAAGRYHLTSTPDGILAEEDAQ